MVFKRPYFCPSSKTWPSRHLSIQPVAVVFWRSILKFFVGGAILAVFATRTDTSDVTLKSLQNVGSRDV